MPKECWFPLILLFGEGEDISFLMYVLLPVYKLCPGPAKLGGGRVGVCVAAPPPIIWGLLITSFGRPPNNLGLSYAAAPPKILTLHQPYCQIINGRILTVLS